MENNFTHQKEKVAYKTGRSNLTFKVNARDSQNHERTQTKYQVPFDTQAM